jgi:hypothetical protein
MSDFVGPKRFTPRGGGNWSRSGSFEKVASDLVEALTTDMEILDNRVPVVNFAVQIDGVDVRVEVPEKVLRNMADSVIDYIPDNDGRGMNPVDILAMFVREFIQSRGVVLPGPEYGYDDILDYYCLFEIPGFYYVET